MNLSKYKKMKSVITYRVIAKQQAKRKHTG